MAYTDNTDKSVLFGIVIADKNQVVATIKDRTTQRHITTMNLSRRDLFRQTGPF